MPNNNLWSNVTVTKEGGGGGGGKKRQVENRFETTSSAKAIGTQSKETLHELNVLSRYR